jgi:hypothetical protein
LRRERHESSAGIAPRIAPCLGVQHQRKESQRLGLLRQ